MENSHECVVNVIRHRWNFLIYSAEEWILARLLILVTSLAASSTYVLILENRGFLTFADSAVFANGKATGSSAAVIRSLTFWGVFITVAASTIITLLWSSVVDHMSVFSMLAIWTYASFSVANATILTIKSVEI